jgi:hypothetical protein
VQATAWPILRHAAWSLPLPCTLELEGHDHLQNFLQHPFPLLVNLGSERHEIVYLPGRRLAHILTDLFQSGP